ncbi:unnamed protein product [Caenorhabditis brenneri]
MLLYFLFVSHTFAENFTIFQSDGVNCDPKCEFKGSSLTSKTLPLFPTTCSRVCGDLEFFENCDLTEQQLTTAFINLKRLIGGVKIIDTNFTSAKFLGGVEYIECGYNMQFIGNNQLLELGLTNLTTLAFTGITVSENDKMRNLNIPNLKNLIPITPSHPDVEVYLTSSSSNNLCITTEVMKLFLRAPTVDKISVKYCDPVINGKMCKELAMGCVEIFGDVEIKSDYQLTLIKDVEVIYGSLTVDGINVTDLSFLEKLEYVATLDKKPAITIQNNQNLVNVTFPKLKRVTSSLLTAVVFKSNNRILVDDPSHCYGVRNSFKSKYTDVLVDDLSCVQTILLPPGNSRCGHYMAWIDGGEQWLCINDSFIQSRRKTVDLSKMFIKLIAFEKR